MCGPLFDTLLVQSQYAKSVCSTETTGARKRTSRILLRLLGSGARQVVVNQTTGTGPWSCNTKGHEGESRTPAQDTRLHAIRHLNTQIIPVF